MARTVPTLLKPAAMFPQSANWETLKKNQRLTKIAEKQMM
jgi:hypothetical protein